MTVAGLRPRHREIGRLRLGVAEPLGKGRKGSKPKALETWRLTSAHLDVMHAATKLWGGQVADWQGQYELITETDSLQVLIPEQDVESSQFLEEWSGGGIVRRCDGTTDLISDEPCLRDSDKSCACTITSHLLVVLPELPDMGIFRLTTRGWGAAAELPEAVRMVRALTETGRYQLPHAELGIEHRTKKVGGETHTFVVPVLRLPYTLAEAGLGGHLPPALPAGVDPETGEILPPGPWPGAGYAIGGNPASPASKKQGAGTSSPAGVKAFGEARPAGEDTTSGDLAGSQSPAAASRASGSVSAALTDAPSKTSGEGTERSHAAPVSSTASTSPDDEAREGEELREEPPAMGPPDVEYPSRRPCLHLNGTKSVYSGSGPMSTRIEVCVDCGTPLEEVRR